MRMPRAGAAPVPEGLPTPTIHLAHEEAELGFRAGIAQYLPGDD